MPGPHRRLEGRNPPRSPYKMQAECGVCGESWPKVQLIPQRGTVACPRCVDNPNVYKGQLSRGPNYGNSGV